MLSTPTTIAYFVFLGLLVWGAFLTGSIFQIALDTRTHAACRNTIVNLSAMFVLFTGMMFALWAISHGWGTTKLERWLYTYLLVFSGLSFLAPFLVQLSLWARFREMTNARAAALRAVR